MGPKSFEVASKLLLQLHMLRSFEILVVSYNSVVWEPRMMTRHIIMCPYNAVVQH
jgi:hypothetical protein